MGLRNEVYAELSDFLHSKCGVDSKDISEETRLVEDLGLDSLDLLAMAQVLQNKYQVSLDDESIADVETIGNVLTFVEGRIAQNARNPLT